MTMCISCLKIKPFSGFHRSTASKDGRVNSCAQCACARVRSWRRLNSERVRATKRDSYLRNKAEYKAKASVWAKENPERRLAIRRKSELKNAAASNQRKRIERLRLKKECPSLLKEMDRRKAQIHHAKRRAAGSFISREMWDAIINFPEPKRCFYCGKCVAELELDHFVPVAKGGLTEAGNLIPCCPTCNRSKNARDADEWMASKGYLRHSGVGISLREFLAISAETDRACYPRTELREIGVRTISPRSHRKAERAA